jgi:[acyl-carrier-protein] S-malonyltransferase
MAAVLGVPGEAVEKNLARVTSGVVDIANWNSEEQIVIAGDKAAVEEALGLVAAPRSVMLPVSAPFHSRLMHPAEEKLAVDLDRTEFRSLEFPVISNVDAAIVRDGPQARDALKRQVSRAVLWTKTTDILKSMNLEACVEVGAGKVLAGLLKRACRAWTQAPAIYTTETYESLERVKAALSGGL